jgi:hypothetical protein
VLIAALQIRIGKLHQCRNVPMRQSTNAAISNLQSLNESLNRQLAIGNGRGAANLTDAAR